MNRPGSEKSKADGQDEAARQLYGYLGFNLSFIFRPSMDTVVSNGNVEPVELYSQTIIV